MNLQDLFPNNHWERKSCCIHKTLSYLHDVVINDDICYKFVADYTGGDTLPVSADAVIHYAET